MDKKNMSILRLESCGGCVQKLLDHPELKEIITRFDISEYSKKEKIDYLIVEGCITTKAEQKIFDDAKERAKKIIIFGSCGSSPEQILGIKAKTIGHYDHALIGCPPSFDAIKEMFSSILQENNPDDIISIKVCDDCAKKEIRCLLLKGKDCKGIETVGGCEVLCPRIGKECTGCRTLVKKNDN